MLEMLTQDPRPMPRRHQEFVDTGRPLRTRNAPSLHLRTTPFGDAFTDAIIATEVYRAHTQPDLYDQWQIDLIDDNWLTLVGERESRDCDGCHKAIVVDHWLIDACPNCGQEA